MEKPILKLISFLQTAGYDVDLDDNLFNITVLGAMNEDETDKHFQNSGHWDFNEYSKI